MKRITYPCIILLLLFCFRLSAQSPYFTLSADTVCVNSPVTITNASTGGSSFYWNFCEANINTTPDAINMGDIGNLFNYPVYVDVVSQNGNYYGFLTNYLPGGLVRLDFGNSMLNTPTAVNMGNFGGMLVNGTEGIQVVNNNGNWYAIIVGGGTLAGSTPRIVKLEFGADITNTTPVATNWGNLGNMSQPLDFFLTNENNGWHGFTVNSENNTVTVFDFGTGFTNPPTGINLGNPGGLLSYPTGICALYDNGNWRAFITNGNNALIVRLDFGSSLLNIPTIANLGNPGNLFQFPRDITILRFCSDIVGFVTDGTTNEISRLDFHNDLLSLPTAVSLGNIGNFNWPISLANFFRVGADLYTLIPNSHNNTLSRVRFAGCNSGNILNSNVQNPPAISYSQPGVYNINLLMDDGLATQGSFCRHLVVLGPPDKLPEADSSYCGDSIMLRSRFLPSTNTWSDGSQQDSLLVKAPGVYWVNTAYYGCTGRDSFQVIDNLPSIKSINDTAVCMGDTVLLKTTIQNMDSLRWSPPSGLSSTAANSPVATPPGDISYIVTAYRGVCTMKDTVAIQVNPLPEISVSNDTLICLGSTVQLTALGAGTYTYQWDPAAGLSDPTAALTAAAPSSSTLYHVTAYGANSCHTKDSVMLTVANPEHFSITPATVSICTKDSILLKVKGGRLGDTYTWSTDNTSTSKDSLLVTPAGSTTYQVVGFDHICQQATSLLSDVTVLPLPNLEVSKSNDVDCIIGQSGLMVTGDADLVDYHWSPAINLSDTLSRTPMVSPPVSTMYYVIATDAYGCKNIDSIEVYVTKDQSLGFPVANAFTPNGDGLNDCFGIKYWGRIDGFEMSIYDRWGMRVYYSNDPTGCWDGTYRGTPQPAGTYVYMIKANTLCGTGFKKGTLELIR